MQGKTSDSREIMEIEKSCHSSFVDKFKSSTQWSTEAKKVNAVFDALVQGIVVSVRLVKCFRNFLLTDQILRLFITNHIKKHFQLCQREIQKCHFFCNLICWLFRQNFSLEINTCCYKQHSSFISFYQYFTNGYLHLLPNTFKISNTESPHSITVTVEITIYHCHLTKFLVLLLEAKMSIVRIQMVSLTTSHLIVLICILTYRKVLKICQKIKQKLYQVETASWSTPLIMSLFKSTV